MNLANALKKTCVQCSRVKTIYRCLKCFNPLCKRCQTKKPRGFPNTDMFLIKGVCKNCVIEWENKIKIRTLKKIVKKTQQYSTFK